MCYCDCVCMCVCVSVFAASLGVINNIYNSDYKGVMIGQSVQPAANCMSASASMR